MTTNTFAPNTRVRVIARPGLTGTFVRYYAALPGGTRNVQVLWDLPTDIYNLHETQIEAI